MKKFAVYIEETIKKQYKVEVMVEDKEELEEALEYADMYRENDISDYLYRLESSVGVLKQEIHLMESDNIECVDIVELSE